MRSGGFQEHLCRAHLSANNADMTELLKLAITRLNGAARFRFDAFLQPSFIGKGDSPILSTSLQSFMKRDASMIPLIGERMTKDLTLWAHITMKFKDVAPQERKHSVGIEGVFVFHQHVPAGVELEGDEFYESDPTVVHRKIL